MESPGHEPCVTRLECILNISKCLGKTSNAMFVYTKVLFSQSTKLKIPRLPHQASKYEVLSECHTFKEIYKLELKRKVIKTRKVWNYHLRKIWKNWAYLAWKNFKGDMRVILLYFESCHNRKLIWSSKD